MKNKTVLVVFGCVLAVAVAFAAEVAGKPAAHSNSPAATAAAPAAAAAATPAPAMPPSALFDRLGSQPDVIYLIANSSVVFGPDPHGRSEEITFMGPVTVPKWPMPGYGRRVLPDGRQQIDIELTQSELTGESYVLNGPVVLGEHPDLRSLGTITERPRTATPNSAPADNNTGNNKDNNAATSTPASVTPVANKTATNAAAAESSEEVPADFVVERKVLLTTAKGILYNETAVPVRGRIDSIPPVKFEGTPTGVNVFRGMELPVALLDRDGNVNGWFYSKAHMAYAVLPAAIERSFVKGTVQLKSGAKTENVEVTGPAEIHHLAAPGSGEQTNMEVMMLALRGHSQLLGGDIMVTETFGDRDHFSRGQLNWQGSNADSKFDLFVDVYTPSAKLTTHEPIALAGQLLNCKINGHLEKGKLNLPLVGGKAQFTSNAGRELYDESEKPVVELGKLQLNLAERM
jgi:hypothetical protein